MAFLKVFTNGDERTVFLGEDPVLLGRGQDTDILVNDLKASRHHCMIEPCGGGRWRVRDLDSGNGTSVNGRKVGERSLEPDDVITIGEARILFAGEGVSVVQPSNAPAEKPAGSRRPRRRSYASLIVMVAVLLVAFTVLLLVWDRGDGGTPRYGAAERMALRAVRNAEGDVELAELAETYLRQYPNSEHHAEVSAKAAQARRRLREGNSAQAAGKNFQGELAGLRTGPAIAKLKTLLKQAKPEHRPSLRLLLAEYREKLRQERTVFFRDLETVFRGHVGKGEYSRAREIWFFLRDEPDWVPIPPAYVNRIVQANGELEAAAAAARTRLLEEVGRAEAAHDFEGARRTLASALPRFNGTSVARSLRERLAFEQRAIERGVEGEATAAPTVVRIDIEKRMEAAYKGLERRDFARTATALRALAAEVRRERGFAEVDARARECEAAAALQQALVADLSAGKLPRGQIDHRWRILGGDASALRVKSKGKELTYGWGEVPAALYTHLLQSRIASNPLGVAVAAYAIGGEAALAEALAQAYAQKRARGALDAFIASRVRKERIPTGGYVVHAGQILSRREHLRRKEEALIRRYTAQFKKAYATILADHTAKRLSKLTKQKDRLDKARTYAKDLIYDEKKYFYPYRNTGRMGEYTKVQQEVDRRVDAVRDLWEKGSPRTIKASPEMLQALQLFDEAAAQLEKRLVYVEEEVETVTFLRSYLGRKFTLHNFYRTPEEKDLLDYTDEVMAFNAQVEGDITDVEREQVRITNEYRIMFGHQPVRLVEKLVKSARGHCEEMSRIGYFGHFSPTPGRHTPYDRMKLEGYDYGSSENIIMGQTNPRGAHNGWCHSSGHHRNLLMPAWTEMGTGHSGRLMTQNFGSAPKYSARSERTDAGTDDAIGESEEEDGGFGYDDDEE